MNTSKGTEEVKEQGAIETKVETQDHRSPAGEDKEPNTENVTVVHLTRDKGRSSVGGGAMAGTAAAAANTLRSAKDAIFDGGKESKDDGTEEVNEQGAIETKVETQDHRSPAGEDKEPNTENVTVVHLTRDKGRSSVGGGAMAGTAAAAVNTLRSAKDAIFDGGKESKDDVKK